MSSSSYSDPVTATVKPKTEGFSGTEAIVDFAFDDSLRSVEKWAIVVLLGLATVVGASYFVPVASPSAEHSVPQREREQKQIETLAAQARRLKATEIERTVRGVVLDLSVPMGGRVLVIPRVDVVLRAPQSERLITQTLKREMQIRDAITRHVQRFRDSEFARVTAESALRSSIAHAINEVLLGAPIDDTRGVERIELPGRFELR